LDVSATVSEEGVVSVVVVNISETRDFEVEVMGVGSDVTVFEVTGENVKAVNTKEKEGVGLTERKWDGKGKFGFKKHSMTMLRWQTGKRISEVVIGHGGHTDMAKLVAQAEAERPT
jgi:alpha-N-arabinofuranosidase